LASAPFGFVLARIRVRVVLREVLPSGTAGPIRNSYRSTSNFGTVGRKHDKKTRNRENEEKREAGGQGEFYVGLAARQYF
jgi:hypothetical protein